MDNGDFDEHERFVAVNMSKTGTIQYCSELDRAGLLTNKAIWVRKIETKASTWEWGGGSDSGCA